MRDRVIFSWSGGKDLALALNRIAADDGYEVVALLSTCNEQTQRVSMHGVRLELLEAQVAAIGLPLLKMFLSARSDNQEYLAKLSACLASHDVRGVVFGDIFLEDLRQWREQHLSRLGLQGIFPLWKANTAELMREFLLQGFEALICCVDDAWLDQTAVGRKLDESFMRSLPPQVDPCGENGEYHSFAYAGPIFTRPVQFVLGATYYRPLEDTHPGSRLSGPSSAGKSVSRGFWFCDLLPV